VAKIEQKRGFCLLNTMTVKFTVAKLLSLSFNIHMQLVSLCNIISVYICYFYISQSHFPENRERLTMKTRSLYNCLWPDHDDHNLNNVNEDIPMKKSPILNIFFHANINTWNKITGMSEPTTSCEYWELFFSAASSRMKLFLESHPHTCNWSSFYPFGRTGTKVTVTQL